MKTGSTYSSKHRKLDPWMTDFAPNCWPAAKKTSKWVAIDQIPHLPITGLTRKILKADGIIK